MSERNFAINQFENIPEAELSPKSFNSKELLLLVNNLKKRFNVLEASSEEENKLLINAREAVEKMLEQPSVSLERIEIIYKIYNSLLKYLKKPQASDFVTFTKEGLELKDDHLLTMEDLIEAQGKGLLKKDIVEEKSITADFTAESAGGDLDIEAREVLGKAFNDKKFGKTNKIIEEAWLDPEDAEEIVDEMVAGQLEELHPDGVMEVTENQIISIEDIVENPEAILVKREVELHSGDEVLEVTEDQIISSADIYKENHLKSNVERTKGVLLNLPKSTDEKSKIRLESKLKNQEYNLEKFLKEKLENNLKSFFESRHKSIDAYLESLVERSSRREKIAIMGLYNIYEKYGSRQLLPGAWNEKLKKHGFLGKLVADGMNVNTAIEFSLLGGGFAVGGSSIIAADILSGLHIPLEKRSDALLSIASEDFVKSHAWESSLSEKQLNAYNYQALLKYMNHYEARTLLEGRSVDADDYYQNVMRIFRKKIEIEKEKGELTEEAIKDFLIEENAKINSELFNVFSKKNISEEDQKLGVNKIVLFIKEGLFKKTLDNLFFSKNKIVKVEKASTTTEKYNAEYDIQIAKDIMGIKSDVDILEQKKKKMFTTEMLDNLKDQFLDSHPVLSDNHALLEIAEDKTQVTFVIADAGHFKLKQEALRVLVMDNFPMQKLTDADGLSALDAGDIENSVTVLNKLLEGKSFHDFSPEMIGALLEMKGDHLVVSDYEKLAVVLSEILKDSESWVSSTKSIYVKMAKARPDELWTKLLISKLKSIK